MPKVKSIRDSRAIRMATLCEKGTKQYIGRPGGPKAKGHKTPATGTLPYLRMSVVPK